MRIVNNLPAMGLTRHHPLGAAVGFRSAMAGLLLLALGAQSQIMWVTNQMIGPVRPYIDVRAFGAVGDGLTRDESAFQRAVNAALATGGGDVHIPPGTYLLGPQSTYSTYDVSVFAFMPPGGRVRLLGEPGATLLTTNSFHGPHPELNEYASLMFYVTGPADSVEFDHLGFVAVHEPEPQAFVTAIMQGWDLGSVTTNLVVKDCWFRDWGVCVSANCAETLVLRDNRFRYTRGRDEAAPGGPPAVAVRTMFTVNVDSSGNDFLGSDIANYSGRRMTVLGPMDGYFNGYALRSSFRGDRIRRNGFEGILLQGRWWPDTNPPTAGGGMSGYTRIGQHVISDCLVDGDIQPGQTYLPWSGVSVLDSGATVQGCRIYDCKTGVYSQWEYPKPAGVGLTSLLVLDNSIRMPSERKWGRQYVASGGGFDQGVLVVGYTGLQVLNNLVFLPDRQDLTNTAAAYIAGVALYGCTNATVAGNWVGSDQPALPSPRLTWAGVVVNGGQNTTTAGNFFQNTDKGVVAPLQPVQASAKPLR